jgi:uncharacterized membrane protein YhhN
MRSRYGQMPEVCVGQTPEVTTTAWVFLGVAGLFAVGDWIAVDRGATRLEYVCKPMTTAALIGCAVTLDPASCDQRWWFVAALCLALVGDVLLMLPGDRFVVGLGAFLLAQLTFAVGFAQHGGSAGGFAIGAVVVALLAGPLALRYVGALRRSGRSALVGPVLAYLGAIGVTVASAIACGNGWAITGALLFFASDALIAETRFVAERPFAPVAIMVTYHFALALLVVSLLP